MLKVVVMPDTYINPVQISKVSHELSDTSRGLP